MPAAAGGTLGPTAAQVGDALSGAARDLSEHAQVAIHDAADRASEGRRPESQTER